HHRRKTNPTTHRQDLAVGRRHRRRLAPNTHRLRLTAEPLPPRPEGPGTRTPGATVGHQTCPAAKISAESLNVSVQQLHSPRHERPRLVVVPGRYPSSTSACTTQFLRVSGLIPSCSPTRRNVPDLVDGSRRA